MASIWAELKRRNVFRVAAAYIIVGWLLLQVSDTLVPALHLPEWFHSGVAFLLILGFPIALIFAWAFELTPEGLKKEKDVDRGRSVTKVTGRKLDFVIIAMLVMALGYFGYDKFVAGPVQPQDSAKTIAVLPFVNMSDDPDNEYFSDGISEEILNLLAKVPEMRVTSRSSAFSFKGQNLDVPTMAARLKVAHVLEGSVRKSGNQLRITAQLIEVGTDTHLWSETYDRTLDNIFEIQDEIAAAVVDALRIRLLGETPKATETNPEAYALYLKGRHFRSQHTIDSYAQAEALLDQALKIDPGFAPAWSELGNVYNDQTNRFLVRPVDEAHKMARNAIQKALEMDPKYGRAWADLGDLEIHYGFNFAAANQYMQKALELSPGDTTIMQNVAHVNDLFGRIEEAIDLYEQSVALDPLSAGGHGGLGRLYYRAHRLEEAADSLQLAVSLNPLRNFDQFDLGMVLMMQGDAPAALMAMKQITIDWLRLFGTAIVQHALGNAQASDAALNELIEAEAEAPFYQVAMVYAFRGQIDLAFDWLDLAYDERDTGLPFVLREPLLANLRDDRRWEPFLDKMGLPH